MRILFWGTYDDGKPRLRVLRDGLRHIGVTVEEIHKNPWSGIEDKSQIRGIWLKLKLVLLWFFAYPGLLWRLARTPKPDLILVSYPALFDVFLAALIGRIRRVPVAWNVFISVYDTIVRDRRLWRRNDMRAKVLYAIERIALRCPQVIFMDTRAHAKLLELLFSLPKDRVGEVWVGVESAVFAAHAERPKNRLGPARLRVLFYGQFIPLHGIPVIVEAARLLDRESVEWILIGRGQEEQKIRAMLEAEPQPNLQWIEWATYDELKQHLAAADLCLGIFGNSEKAASVIPNKVFQIVAAGRPLITRDSDAIRELLVHAPPCTYLVPPGDPAAVAAAISAHVQSKPSEESCHRELQTRINEAAVAKQFLSLIETRLERSWTRD